MLYGASRGAVERVDAGAFVVEGPVVVSEVVAAGAVLRDVFVDADAWADASPGSALVTAVERAAASGTPVWSLAVGTLAGVTDTVTPQGLVAVAERRPTPLDDVVGAEGPVVVLVDVSDPGNAGTLVRTAEAAGAAGVVFAGGSTDAWGPKAVRAAAGSLLRLAVAEERSVGVVLEALAASDRSVVASVVDGGQVPDAVDLTGAVALLLGSEAHGLPSEVLDRADHLLTIPMAPGPESLNAAVAGAVLLFEAARQRRAASSPGGGEVTGAAGMDWTTTDATDRLGDR